MPFKTPKNCPDPNCDCKDCSSTPIDGICFVDADGDLSWIANFATTGEIEADGGTIYPLSVTGAEEESGTESGADTNDGHTISLSSNCGEINRRCGTCVVPTASIVTKTLDSYHGFPDYDPHWTMYEVVWSFEVAFESGFANQDHRLINSVLIDGIQQLVGEPVSSISGTYVFDRACANTSIPVSVTTVCGEEYTFDITSAGYRGAPPGSPAFLLDSHCGKTTNSYVEATGWADEYTHSGTDPMLGWDMTLTISGLGAMNGTHQKLNDGNDGEYGITYSDYTCYGFPRPLFEDDITGSITLTQDDGTSSSTTTYSGYYAIRPAFSIDAHCSFVTTSWSSSYTDGTGRTVSYSGTDEIQWRNFIWIGGPPSTDSPLTACSVPNFGSALSVRGLGFLPYFTGGQFRLYQLDT